MAKILILGNGFDLAHNMPTRYTDFLDFINKYNAIEFSDYGVKYYTQSELDSWDVPDYLKSKLQTAYEESYNNISQLHTSILNECLRDNIWINYFHKLRENNIRIGINWVDFETELKYIIRAIDDLDLSTFTTYNEWFNKLRQIYNDDRKIALFLSIIENRLGPLTKATTLLDNIRQLLYNDLEKLTLAFEIYLTHFVEISNATNKLKFIDEIKPDYVLNFNYTQTYEKLYKHSNCEICHIHGMIRNNVDNAAASNLVLGIDEYLDEKQRNEKTDFACFKKFIQRIRNHNDIRYASWLNDLNRGGMGVHELWIYGHSLNITDKDILSKFMGIEHIRVNIFAKDKASEGQLVENLIKIIGVDNVMLKSTSSPLELNFHVIEDKRYMVLSTS